jgi:hypothetical protein
VALKPKRDASQRFNKAPFAAIDLCYAIELDDLIGADPRT